MNHRGKYFAIVRALGLDDDARHELNAQLVGVESCRGLTDAQWLTLLLRVAQLAPTDAPLPVRLYVPKTRGDGRDDLATPRQVARIIDLCHQVSWTSSPEAFLRARVLGVLRGRNWGGWFDSLWNREASDAISALERMRNGPHVQRPVPGAAAPCHDDRARRERPARLGSLLGAQT